MLWTQKNNSFYDHADIERRVGGGGRSAQDLRDPFERDHGRIIHSAAFRRLQSKKQVIGTDLGDFHRTRLTHSMEVAQIARGIALSLNQRSPFLQDTAKIDISLVEAAALAHDLGHPPFAHEGERALHQCMFDFGGFEGNAQTFRILSRLEGKKGEGLKLTRALLLAIMKYPVQMQEVLQTKEQPLVKEYPPKVSIYDVDSDVFEWVLHPYSQEEIDFFTDKDLTCNKSPFVCTTRMSLECSLINLADDIAYATHDLEDAINFRFVEMEELCEMLEKSVKNAPFEELNEAYRLAQRIHTRREDFKYLLKEVFAFLISAFVNYTEVREEGEEWFSPRFRFRVVIPKELNELIMKLKKVVELRVIHSPGVQALAFKGDRTVRLLFEAMMAEEKLLPENDRQVLEENPDLRARIVCDYISGMTDPYALSLVERLYGSGRTFL
ncbi:anti-phage deoxyguanosine triphosphatase [Melghirimyces algeriensis]|uniref:Deoxyguanosinetriphosphate triphosphohydrolase-like protein n=1 Tax=Melghirimyces algeriensis TaxID=910412 RepID=A0A521AVK4_9BACL|nr:anti-phage deoxyguanosine triphosphatase [Melghirimyces algeriensis]SMO38847.1 dGTPase [Melghirimyces algeriensis]